MYWHFSSHTAAPLFSQRSEVFHSSRYFSGLLFSSFLKKHVWKLILSKLFPCLTQNIKGSLNYKFGAACLSPRGDRECLHLDTSSVPVTNFPNSFGRLIPTVSCVICSLSLPRLVLHFIEQSALRCSWWHLTCISFFRMDIKSTSVACITLSMNFCLAYFLCSKNIVFPEKQKVHSENGVAGLYPLITQQFINI